MSSMVGDLIEQLPEVDVGNGSAVPSAHCCRNNHVCLVESSFISSRGSIRDLSGTRHWATGLSDIAIGMEVDSHFPPRALGLLRDLEARPSAEIFIRLYESVRVFVNL